MCSMHIGFGQPGYETTGFFSGRMDEVNATLLAAAAEAAAECSSSSRMQQQNAAAAECSSRMQQQQNAAVADVVFFPTTISFLMINSTVQTSIIGQMLSSFIDLELQ